MSRERGSTIPLILGFFVLALLVIGGAVALGEAFVQQRDLQDVCDGAAAAAASAVDLERGAGRADGAGPADGAGLRFAAVEPAVRAYLSRDGRRAGVRVHARLSADRRRLTLRCEQTTPLALGALVGRGRVHHVATSSVRAAVRGP